MRSIGRPYLRCFAATLSLLAYLVITLGWFPVTRRVDKNQEPFPCENCACSCSSAAECWTSCCCFTVVERLEWAKRRQVSVPAEYLKHLKQDELPSCGCCDKLAKRTESGQHDSKGAGSFLSELKCSGLTTFWVLFGAVLAPKLETQGFRTAQVGVLFSWPQIGYESNPPEPPEPVPIARRSACERLAM